jgi:ribonuclease-3
MNGSLERLQSGLGYRFSDASLLALALTHRSCGARNNERLEFLGDSILNHIVAEALYQRFTGASEGELSRMRATLVKGETLADIARELDLGEYVRLGPGELKSGGHRRDSILADAFESLVGAVLLDGGIEACRACVLSLVESRLADLSPRAAGKDPKTRLQEYLQGRGKPLPEYRTLDVSGEDHAQQFSVVCSLPELKVEREGSGSSRRRAEQAAAGACLKALNADA